MQSLQDPSATIYRTSVLRHLTSSRISIALDTEFQFAHTLTIQAAARLGPRVLVQLYHSPAIPPLPSDFDLQRYLPRTAGGYGRFFETLKVRPAKRMHSGLSPVGLLNDLLNLQPPLLPVSREEGYALLPQPSSEDPPVTQRLPTRIHLRLIGHFWPADFLRIFGCDFYRALLQQPSHLPPVAISDGKILRFETKYSSFTNFQPVVQFAQDTDGAIYPITLSFCDTQAPFGSASLDSHSRTFLQLGKNELLADQDKRVMLKTYQQRTHDAYGYAIVDAVNTLLVYEEMAKYDRAIYQRFDHPGGIEMAPTLGRRVANFLVAMTQEHVAKDSQVLAVPRDLKQLLAKGGSTIFSGDQRASRYGETTGKIHGGLSYSRSPCEFAHCAPGMLRDVDMRQCYNRIASQLDVYWGRPVIFEPGSRKLKLRDAVKMVEGCCQQDAWFLRVTGDIQKIANTLIPSTDGARTSENYKKRQSEAVAGARLYSRRIDSGVVTSATWLMIQALPAAARREYEALSVDSLVMYPTQFVANDGVAFDALVDRLRQEHLPWKSLLDLKGRKICHVETLDEEYACLRFPLHKNASALARLRDEAQQQEGKGSGLAAALKLQANSLYGVLASNHLPTCNVVAANQITAHARAAAFGLMMALNGIQVITDGCTFRKDRVPACTFAECLRRQPDYPLRGADEDSGIPFLDQAQVPDDPVQFNRWYRQHVKSFFGVTDEYDKVFGLHSLQFKEASSTGDVTFDALLCDGSGNYLKCSLNSQNQLEPVASAFRGYRPESVAKLIPWLLRTYTTDRFTGPAPLILERGLLKLVDAKRQAKKALRQGMEPVLLPLGLPAYKLRDYRIFKPSAFVFQTPVQRRNFERQLDRFKRRTGCGLEVLALRRGYGDRRANSITDLAQAIYELIQNGKKDFSKALHWNRNFDGLAELSEKHRQLLHQLRHKATEWQRKCIQLADFSADHPAMLTGCHCRLQDPVLE